MSENHLVMQSAYATWVQGEDDNQWIVRNKDGEEIAKLPSSWDEQKCMAAIRLARIAEKSAFEFGVNVGREAEKAKCNNILKQTDKHIRFIEEQNERLSEKLEQLIIGQEN